MTTDLERRAHERHGSAALRAVSGRPTAELRGHRLHVDGRAVSMATPYLTLDTNTADQKADVARSRGIADALGLLLRNSNIDIHLARLLEETATGRSEMIDELRSEIRVLSRTLAAIAEKAGR